MRTLLAALGDPQRAYPAIHVVGTNGKSTATRTIEALLLAEGLSVGATSRRTSAAGRADHGRRRGGRLRGGARARPARGGGAGATQFEVLTAAALAEFAAREVDVAVVEAGLGGRLDATNVLRAHVVLLTNVGLEHTDVLGETREAIAAEKLAVVQEGTIVVAAGEEFAHLAGRERRRSAARARRPRRSSAARVEHEVEVALPGRLERRGDEIWDGAHNADGAALARRPARRDDYTRRRLDPRATRTSTRCSRARDAGGDARRDPVGERPRAPGRGARARSPRRTSPGRDRARSGRRARPRARARPPVLVTGSLYLLADLWRGTRRDMTKMRERLTVLAFALACSASSSARVRVGYLVGRLLL